MHESYTFDFILKRMLDKVSETIDKREGSIIYTALAPAAAELAQMYIELDTNINLSYADTATGIYLERRANERGIYRSLATKAIRKGYFTGSTNLPLNVHIGSRFSDGNLNYSVVEKITDGEYKLECEQAGESGNTYIGKLLPIDYIENLVSANLFDILIPGENIETDESLRKRYFDSLNSQAFGGNITDYKEKITAQNGIGGVKVYPVWNGGGTVKLVIIDSTYNKPSADLISNIQTITDPIQNQGKGVGFAPIGHTVTVAGVEEVTINIISSITFQSGYTWSDIKQKVISAINEYFKELKKTWAHTENLVVRISQLESKLLNVSGVLDVQNTKINGTAQNLLLSDIQIPVLGEVTAI